MTTHHIDARQHDDAGALPPIGAFLRPIGIHGFCWSLRVTHHWDEGRIEYERWGLKDGRVIDDGHVMPGHVRDLVPTLIPGVWRDPFDFGGHQSWCCCPIYYRLTNGPTGQGDLFS